MTDSPIKNKLRVIDYRHPQYTRDFTDWEKFRLCYQGGEGFVRRYLEQFSTREDQGDFTRRQKLTPIPTFAKSAIHDIRNAVFQRMSDIIRRGGSDAYQKAIAGVGGGVDNRGSTMNSFLGQKVLTDLLTMGRIGIYVDAPATTGATLANPTRPYVYPYQIEDICSWTQTTIDQKSEYSSLLLRDTVLKYDGYTGLPDIEYVRYRHIRINERGFVEIQFYDIEDNPISPDGEPGMGPIELELTRIPFVMLDLGGSLLEDVCSYQIALLNLISSDVNYALLANFPFYVEQGTGRGGHLKPVANKDGTATAGGQGASDKDIKIGVTQGREYAAGMQQPDFIHPSPDPLLASMKLRDQLQEEVRKLVNLAAVNLAQRASAQSKEMDNQGLEAGLSYIGLVLENGERRIADYWAMYERPKKVATISYPTRYSLKSDEQRIEEASKLAELMYKVPGRVVKKELAKSIVTVLLAHKIGPDHLQEIYDDIDAAEYCTSDPETIIKAKEAGLVGEKIASIALGFSETEFEQAREDHLARIIRIAESQTGGLGAGAAARGVDDADPNPDSGRQERQESQDNTFRDSTEDRVRGEGR